jgi:phenylalanyl-tRNA synthetase beta chain
MKIALDWIAEYLSPTPAPAPAAEALMNAGLPVESIADAMGVQGPTHVLDVEVTSNRTDCFCHVGLARELSALLGGTFTPPSITLKESATPAASLTRVAIDDLVGCPYYSARILRNVKIAPSPEWLRRRVEAIGMRSINNVADITNYVMMELGQPLHAFDFDKLTEKRIVVRRAARGEKMLAIDGREYPLEPHMLLICDAQYPVAIAGVMGGKLSEVTDGTTNILLESAHFEPLSIRTTSRALALKSDASFRFERGFDPTMAEVCSRRAAQLMLELAGGELASGVVSAGTVRTRSLEISMRLQRFQEIVGIPVSADRARSILASLGFPLVADKQTAESIAVRVPTHRLDVEREIDLIEEVARVHGYGHVPTLDRVAHAVTPEAVREKALRALRAALVEAGFSEAVTVTFIPEADALPFAAGAMVIHPQHAGWKSDVLRPSLLPSLLAARRTNQYAGLPDAHLFETASIFLQQGDVQTRAPLERRLLAAVAGDVNTLTGLARLLIQRLNPAARVITEPADFPFYVVGASAEVRLQNPAGRSGAIGNVGLFTPDLQKKYDLRHAAAGLELDLESLLNLFQPVRRAAPVPRFPGIDRDLSLVLAEAVRWADIRAALESAKLPALDSDGGIEFVTTFRNAQIGKGNKSLTLTLHFRAPERTLTSEEVDPQVKTAVDLLAQKFQATLRA